MMESKRRDPILEAATAAAASAPAGGAADEKSAPASDTGVDEKEVDAAMESAFSARFGLGGSSHVLANGKHVVLCFDSAAFSKPQFDAHAFVSQYLTASGNAATAISTSASSTRGDDILSAGAGGAPADASAEPESESALGGSIIPAHATSLETLMRDLQLYGDELKSALIDLLNREYTDFIGLTSNIVTTPETLLVITRQLSGLRARIERVHSHVRAALTAVQTKMSEREAVSARRAALSVVYEVHTAVRNVKQLLMAATDPALSATPQPQTRVATAAPAAKADTKSGAAAADDRNDPIFDAYSESLLDDRIDAPFIAALESGAAAENELFPPAAIASGSAVGAVSASTHTRYVLSELSVLMERLARQWSRLKVLMRYGQSFTLVSDLNSEVDRIERQIERKLEHTLLLALEHATAAVTASASAAAAAGGVDSKKQPASTPAADPSVCDVALEALDRTLRAFVYADKRSVAEQIVRERIVRPLVTAPDRGITKDRITRITLFQNRNSFFNRKERDATNAKQSDKSGAGSESEDTLPALYASLIEFIQTKCGVLLSARKSKRRAPAAAATGIDELPADAVAAASPFMFDFLCNSVWREIGSALLAPSCQLLFAPGIPDTFHRFYTTSMAFIAHLEAAFCPTPESANRFRVHPTTVEFRKKWNVQIYYSLRFQSLAGALETAITRTPHVEYAVLLPVPYGTPLPAPPSGASTPAAGSVNSGSSSSGGGIAVALPVSASGAVVLGSPANSGTSGSAPAATPTSLAAAATSTNPTLAADPLHNELVNYTQTPLTAPVPASFGVTPASPISRDLGALIGGGGPNPHLFALEASVTLWRASELCWAERGGVWIGGSALNMKWLKLTIQLWTRYCSWIATALPSVPATADDGSDGKAAAAPAAAGGSAAATAAAAAAGDEKSDESGDSSGDSSAGGCTWNGQPIAIQTVMFVWFDVNKLRSRLSTQLMPHIFQRLLTSLPLPHDATTPSPAAQLALRKALDASFAGTLERLASLASSLHDCIVHHTSRRCVDVLTAVTKIKQQYRMTGKPPPSAASAYVQHILAPVRMVLAIDTSTAPVAVSASGSAPPSAAATAAAAASAAGFFTVSALIHNPASSTAPPAAAPSSNGVIAPPNPIVVAASVLIRQQLPPTHRDAQRIAEAVLRRVTLRFQSRVSELLEIVEKIDISLKRLQKKTAASSSSSSEVSDSDKIRLQLNLDVSEYGRLATHLLNGVGCNLPRATHPNSPQQVAASELNALAAMVQNWGRKPDS